MMPAAQVPSIVLARAVLVDPRQERLAVTRALMERSGLVAVIGEAATASAALEVVGQTGAEVVIEEIQMPVDEGLATIALLRSQFPLLRIVVCSFHQEATTRRRAMDNGADAYLAKPIDVAALRALLVQFEGTAQAVAATPPAAANH